MSHKTHHFVPITGVVHLATALGVFLDVGDRRVFLRYSDTSCSLRRLVAGETVTLDVRRSFAEAEGLIASRS
jgi:hypothetical protein